MFDSWSDGEVFTVVEDAHREVAMMMARTLAGIAELLDRRTAEELEIDLDVRSMITGFNRTAVEVGAVLNMTSARARVLVRQADALQNRLPAVGALLAAGQVDWNTTELVLNRTDLVDDDLMPRLDAHVADQLRDWATWSRRNVKDAIDAEVNTLDADAAKKRRERAYDERGVSVEVGLDGIAVVRATMTAEEGAALDTRLTARAKTVCAQDPRSLRARRADAFTALQNGRVFTCACASEDCPTRTPAETAEAVEPITPPGPEEATAPDPEAPSPPQPEAPALAPPARASEPRVVLNVIASPDTLAGHSNAPGYLAGYGVIDADLCRELAREATRRLIEEPLIDDSQALTYRPSAALARYIRARDLTCRFPGCTVPAQRCDIDHTEPFNHDDPAAGGQTVPWNLACYCREHHRIKTHDAGWSDRQLADGTLVFTSPAGKTIRTRPGGVALFPGLAPKPRRAAERNRVAAARTRLRAHRDTSTYHHYRNRAAKEEIRQRCWRNDFRRRYLLFKGDFAHNMPSKSPLARFVNDPIEPEPLQPGWQPPPLHPTNPDQPPPF